MGWWWTWGEVAQLELNLNVFLQHTLSFKLIHELTRYNESTLRPLVLQNKVFSLFKSQ